MRITQFSDYSMRVLIYTGLKNDLSTISEITKAFGSSRNHLVKVVHRLSQLGYLKSFQGKSGGIRLAVDPNKIKIGNLIKQLEPMNLLECFNKEINTCPIQGVCQLERSLYEARDAFIESLNRYTLADFFSDGPMKRERMRRLGL